MDTVVCSLEVSHYLILIPLDSSKNSKTELHLLNFISESDEKRAIPKAVGTEGNQMDQSISGNQKSSEVEG